MLKKMREIKKIIIEVIPHEKQLYETVGNFYFDVEGNLRVYVSDLGDNRFSLLVAVHELIEVLQTEHEGIMEPDIAKFDIDFEKKRQKGNLDEPGDDPAAPYKKQHCIATAVERLMCAMLDCDWKSYEGACNTAGVITEIQALGILADKDRIKK